MDDRSLKKTRQCILQAGLEPPDSLTLALTPACNLRCRHCWPESQPYEKTGPVPTETLARIIHEGVRLGIWSLCLTGGEPMTHPDWRKILSFACEQTDLCEVKLQTNGTLLNERVVEALASLDHKKLLIQISMEGASEKTHDPIRGEGTFRRAMRAIQCLFEAGMGNQIVVAFTEMHHNFGDLPLLLKLLEPFNIRSLVSGTLVCGGRALRDQEITGPTTSQYKNLLYRYSVDPQFRESYEQFGNIAALEWYKGRAHSSQNGCALIKNLYITGHGRMYPCPLLQADDFSVLNVHEEALDNALLGALPKWAALSRISQQRPAELRPCEGCPGRVHCAGGCMGRAYSVHGEFMFPEDRCLLRRTVYSWKPPEAPPE